MKKLVVFYSLEGNTRLMAETIARTVNADILELKPKHEINSKGVMKYLWGGKAALMKAKPEMLPLEKEAEKYDLLFIGTPVWAWTYAPPLNSFFAQHPLTDKKIALFCCHGGGKGKIFEKMKKALENNQILGQIDFWDPLKRGKDNNIQKAKDWAENIMRELTKNP